jgi:hypothetical protein
MTQQGGFPGMPDPEPGIWPDYEHLGREPMRVGKVHLSLTGSRTLEAGDELDESLARELYVGSGQSLQVSVKITKTGHKVTDHAVEGTAVGVIDYIVPTEDGAAIKFLAQLGEYRDAARLVETRANSLSDHLSRMLRAQMQAGRPLPLGLEESHDALRAAIDALRAIG